MQKDKNMNIKDLKTKWNKEKDYYRKQSTLFLVIY